MPETRTPQAGEIWRDRDKRRAAAGDIRRFRVLETSLQGITGMVGVREVGGPRDNKLHYFKLTRFYSKAANDALEREDESNG